MVMRIAGLATGMDIDQIVKDLMRAERIPMNRLFQKREWLSWQRDAYREINLALRNFRDTYSNMRLQSTFIGLKATSSNEAGLKASATASAIAGTYTVVVDQLAKGAEISSSQAITINGTAVKGATKIFDALRADLGEGATLPNEITIVVKVSNDGGSSWKEANITITQEDTFASLAQKIARATDAEGKSLGLQASFDDTLGRFFISTKETGGNMRLTIEDAKDNGGNPIFEFVHKYIFGEDGTTEGTKLPAEGQDAMFKIDGYDVVHSSNTVNVRGLNLTLMQTGTYTITVQSNPDEVFNKIKAFVDAYNELVDKINAKLNEPRYRDYPPLTKEEREALSEKEVELWEEKAKSGLLRNDALLREVLYSLRQAFNDPVEGIPQGQLRHLSEIGITTTPNWRDGGKLMIDETKLRKAIEERPEEVMALFTQAPTEAGKTGQMGIGRRVYEVLGTAMSKITDKAGISGVTLGDQSVLGKQIKELDNQLSRWEDKLAKIEERYWRQFTAMEKAIQQMNEQSAMLYNYFFGMIR